MNHSDFTTFLDGFNRLAKLDLDLGDAADTEAAMARLRDYRAHVVAGPEIADSLAHQVALLTFVNIASRFALGGVTVSGISDVPLLAPWPGASLASAIEALGGAAAELSGAVPVVIVGGGAAPAQHRGCQITFAGWRGGVVPLGGTRLDEKETLAAAAVLAGSLAAAEIFATLRGEPGAGCREQGLSIWRPDGEEDWRSPTSDGPPVSVLPNHLWVLGLGHLGQAFLWTLAMSPYSDRASVKLVLQDTDIVTGSTASTSILTRPGSVGRKTRTVAALLENLGFKTSVVERPFDGAFARRPDDPSILICGVDNALARSQLELPQFELVIEAGIGRTASDFRAVRMHSFPSQRTAAELWKAGATEHPATLDNAPGYQRLRESGVDACGLALLAGTAVGAPFVGGVAGALMFGQILKLLHGERPDAVVDLDLRALQARRAVASSVPLLHNPGFQPCDDRSRVGQPDGSLSMIAEPAYDA
jgi:hypothetical protein